MSSTEEQLTPAERKLRATRLALYLHTAKGRFNENFGMYPCLGLHFGFGDSEIERLQKACARHKRQDQFDNLTVPVDVLLRTLSFIPCERDSRMVARMRADNNNNNVSIFEGTKKKVSDDAAAAADELAVQNITRAGLLQKTMFRVAATCSTLLYTLMENKCILGAKKPPKDLVSKATIARSEFLKKQREERLQQRRDQEAAKLRDKIDEGKFTSATCKKPVRPIGSSSSEDSFTGTSTTYTSTSDDNDDEEIRLKPAIQACNGRTNFEGELMK